MKLPQLQAKKPATAFERSTNLCQAALSSAAGTERPFPLGVQGADGLTKTAEGPFSLGVQGADGLTKTAEGPFPLGLQGADGLTKTAEGPFPLGVQGADGLTKTAEGPFPLGIQDSNQIPQAPCTCHVQANVQQNETRVAVLEHPEKRTLRLLGLYCPQNSSVGIAASDVCTLRQLFAADAASAQVTGLKIEIDWQADKSKPFLFQFYGNTEQVKKAAATFSRVLSSNMPLFAEAPTEMLRRRLCLGSGCVGALENCSLPMLLPEMNDYWHSHPESTLEIFPGRQWVLLGGEKQELQQALQLMQHRKNSR
ncbi:MAG: hypothetical protein PHU79_02595 [Oscillospiraceae bacterium]|nr:hypothetical protein [Oscillospiraceae bacterium]